MQYRAQEIKAILNLALNGLGLESERQESPVKVMVRCLSFFMEEQNIHDLYDFFWGNNCGKTEIIINFATKWLNNRNNQNNTNQT